MTENTVLLSEGLIQAPLYLLVEKFGTLSNIEFRNLQYLFLSSGELTSNTHPITGEVLDEVKTLDELMDIQKKMSYGSLSPILIGHTSAIYTLVKMIGDTKLTMEFVDIIRMELTKGNLIVSGKLYMEEYPSVLPLFVLSKDNDTGAIQRKLNPEFYKRRERLDVLTKLAYPSYDILDKLADIKIPYHQNLGDDMTTVNKIPNVTILFVHGNPPPPLYQGNVLTIK